VQAVRYDLPWSMTVQLFPHSPQHLSSPPLWPLLHTALLAIP